MELRRSCLLRLLGKRSSNNPYADLYVSKTYVAVENFRVCI
jgi:hypothetical protein